MAKKPDYAAVRPAIMDKAAHVAADPDNEKLRAELRQLLEPFSLHAVFVPAR